MFQGHYGPAGLLFFIRNHSIPLSWLILSTQWIDVVFYTSAILCEKLFDSQIDSCPYKPWICGEYATYNVDLMRKGRVTPMDFSIDYTHSILGVFILSLVYSMIYWIYSKVSGKKKVDSLGKIVFIMFLGAFSHWILDFLVHRKDLLAFFPISNWKGGLGWWDYPNEYVFCLETFLVLLGCVGILIGKAKRGQKLTSARFLLSFGLYLSISVILTYVAVFDDAKKHQENVDKVVHGSIVKNGPDLLVLFTYFVSATLGYFMEEQQQIVQKKD
ncbi:predicted protein [Naegleria gruberi]|uniref:Predicted protein n=1 Tax=Naegleria gruberi TaxID=5762 RepID=D2W3X0_NAEGR|nr:uncharacterized protein NAEGRDRAFT_76096 [Naegleria gruberi]EFC36247.1 predicted protein [Naegleria gruberi]|eukprot:XP_002668991.1 predicted protein [Naegleria gruberi strain NEG-M]